MKNTDKKFLLIILDGWGIGDKSQSDLIHNGDTPYFKSLLKNYINSQLIASGESVGLPDGQMGNSEVGHLNIGAGRIVYQDLLRINIDIRNNTILKNPIIIEAINKTKENNKSLHLLGLVSDGGVHSHISHLYKLCDIAKENGLNKVFIHCLMDGRDTSPKNGIKYIQDLQTHLKTSSGKIASICGRYYTMDRDKRWTRIKEGYDLLVYGIGNKEIDPIKAMENSYNNNITDEFIKPIVIIDEKNEPITTIQDGDTVLCFNFRTDRLRQITTALTQQDLPEFGMKKLNLNYYTMTEYDNTFKNISVIYKKEFIKNTLGEVISNSGLTQLRIAETEKYAHVTFFFSGGREKKFDKEERILIDSPKVSTYDLQPEMSAFLVKDALVKELKKQKFNFICLNIANGDMVGHTAIKEAILKAVKTVDICIKEIIETATENGYDCLLIADHGNADHYVYEDGKPDTAHSLNPVPCILINNKNSQNKYNSIKNGKLCDIAPTILKLMDIPIPKEMTGEILIK